MADIKLRYKDGTIKRHQLKPGDVFVYELSLNSETYMVPNQQGHMGEVHRMDIPLQGQIAGGLCDAREHAAVFRVELTGAVVTNGEVPRG